MDRNSNNKDNSILTWAHLKDFMGRITHKFYSRDIEVPNNIFIAKQSGTVDQGNQSPSSGEVTIGNDNNTATVSIYNPNLYGNIKIDNTDIIQKIVDSLGSYTVINLIQDLNNNKTDVADTYTLYRSQSFIGKVGSMPEIANSLEINGFSLNTISREGGGSNNTISKDGSLVVKNNYDRNEYDFSVYTDDALKGTINSVYQADLEKVCNSKIDELSLDKLGYTITNWKYSLKNNSSKDNYTNGSYVSINDNILRVNPVYTAKNSKYAIYYKIQDLNAEKTDVLTTYSLESKTSNEALTGNVIDVTPKTISGYTVTSPYNTTLTVLGNDNTIKDSGDTYTTNGELASVTYNYNRVKYNISWIYSLDNSTRFTGDKTQQYYGAYVITPKDRVYVTGGKHVTKFNINGVDYEYNQKTNTSVSGDLNIYIDAKSALEPNKYTINFNKNSDNLTVLNDINGTTASQSRTYGDGVALSGNTFTSNWYNFKCWNNGFYNLTNSTTEDIGGNMSEADVNLKAIWELGKVKYNFNIDKSTATAGGITIQNLIDSGVVTLSTSETEVTAGTASFADVEIPTISYNGVELFTPKSDSNITVSDGKVSFSGSVNDNKYIIGGVELTAKDQLAEIPLVYEPNASNYNIQIAHYVAAGGIDGSVSSVSYSFNNDVTYTDSKFQLNKDYNFGNNIKVYIYLLPNGSSYELSTNDFNTTKTNVLGISGIKTLVDGQELNSITLSLDNPIVGDLIILYQNNN